MLVNAIKTNTPSDKLTIFGPSGRLSDYIPRIKKQMKEKYSCKGYDPMAIEDHL